MTDSPAPEMTVPLLDLVAQYQPIRDDVLRALTRVCDSQRFILGPEVEALERELAAFVEVEHTVAVSSGTDALLAVLMAVGVGPGTEVITPTYSFFASAGSVSRLGATPVFVDIDPVTFNVDPAAIARAVSPRTRAILPVHLFGLCAEMDAILDIGRKADVPVIEDAAQAMGARFHGQFAGRFGLAGCFSFFPSKNLGAYGDGGLITTNDASLAEELKRLRNHGATAEYIHGRIGGNFRLDALQAAVLRVKLPHLTDWSDARRRNADRYRALFAEFDLTRTVELPVEPPGLTHIYNQFVIRVPRRDELRSVLTARQIGTAVYYPVPFHRQQCFATLGRASDAFPVADHAAETSLALPIYGELSADAQRYVVSAIAEFYRGPR
jgi:dTDP-4-amino-4,6-dideoxygalactose transaminase